MFEVYALVDRLADLSGQTPDKIRFILVLLAVIPAGFLHKFVSNRTLRHVYCIVMGAVFGHFAYGNGIINCYISAFVAYLLMIVLPHGVAHKAIFVVALGFMSFCHIYRMYIDWMGWSLDFSTAQMMLTPKLTSLAFNYFDGSRKPEELSKSQQQRALKTLPSLLEFASYIGSGFGFISGPTFEFKDHMDFINLPGKEKTMPSTFLPSMKLFGQSVLVVAIHLALSIYFPASRCVTDEFDSYSFLYKCFYFQVSMMGIRCMYYFNWTLAESGLVAAGMGYNGTDKNGNEIHDRVRGVNIAPIEYATHNPRLMIENWNMSVARWLKNYVYLRACPEDQIRTNKKKASFANYLTYMVSAFWHGFYPTYYLFFFLFGMVNECAKNLHRIRPSFVRADGTHAAKREKLWSLVAWILSHQICNFLGIAFVLLDHRKVFRFWASVYYVHVAGLLAVGIYFMVRPPRAPKAVEKKE